MRSFQVFNLCKAASAVSLSRGFRTDSVLLGRVRGRVPRTVPNEPGIRHRAVNFQEDAEIDEEIEASDIEDEVDLMNIDRAYDLNKEELRKKKTRLKYLITAKKFFSPRTQPLTLTCNEREIIRYLHKQDPVQWNVKVLSESFPATPETIKKIIKGKWKITPERAKILDSRVQKNWELLAEGKLDADSNVLDHLKKFVNRREVLLEQIKNEKFYLPQVKKEHVWNNGEFSRLLSKYEREVEKFLAENEMQKEPKLLSEKTLQENDETKEEENNAEIVHKKINEAISRHELEEKDSFIYGKVIDFYSKEITLEDFENKLLKKANTNKKLDLFDKAILDSKTNLKSYSENSADDVPLLYNKVDKKTKTSSEENNFRETNKDKKPSSTTTKQFHMKEAESSDYIYVKHEKTQFTGEIGIGKLLQNLNKPPPTEESKPKGTEDRLEIDYSDPGRIERENKYYDKEVKDIEKTAFWKGTNCEEKAKIELAKPPYGGPPNVGSNHNFAQTAILSTDTYPDRIKIPKHLQGSGLTFKIKDCYYDDDGMFLYRVPGMTK